MSVAETPGHHDAQDVLAVLSAALGDDDAPPTDPLSRLERWMVQRHRAGHGVHLEEVVGMLIALHEGRHGDVDVLLDATGERAAAYSSLLVGLVLAQMAARASGADLGELLGDVALIAGRRAAG